jgi:hypothetical protein
VHHPKIQLMRKFSPVRPRLRKKDFLTFQMLLYEASDEEIKVYCYSMFLGKFSNIAT